jgi:hypothetical protein
LLPFGCESPERIKDKRQQHLPGEEAWLVGERRTSGEKKYYLANLPAATDLRALAATIKARWIYQQAHQQLKEELGLITLRADHGKVSIVMRCDHDRLRLLATPSPRTSGRKKGIAGPPPQPSLPAVRHAIIDLIPSTVISAMPILQKTNP